MFSTPSQGVFSVSFLVVVPFAHMAFLSSPKPEGLSTNMESASSLGGAAWWWEVVKWRDRTGWAALLAQVGVTRHLVLAAEPCPDMWPSPAGCQLFPWLWSHPMPSCFVASRGCLFVPQMSPCPNDVLTVLQYICDFHENVK